MPELGLEAACLLPHLHNCIAACRQALKQRRNSKAVTGGPCGREVWLGTRAPACEHLERFVQVSREPVSDGFAAIYSS